MQLILEIYLNRGSFMSNSIINQKIRAKISQQIISMRKQQNNIPKREIHWKKYSYLRVNQEKVYYQCECGKKYISFPALYLHFQRKHHRKIKNLHYPNEFQLITNENQTIYRFLLKQGEFQKRPPFFSSIEKKNHLFFDNIFSEFQKQCKQRLLQYAEQKSISKIFGKFSQFLQETQSAQYIKDQFQSMKILSNLPYKFNQFIFANKIKMKKQSTFFTICSILFEFSKWLNFKNYSQLIVELNVLEQSSEDTAD